MKIYVMSNIHGYLQEFEAALELVDLSGDNKLILLGDAPRLYMTEDGCYDITMTIIIPYDFYEVASLETEDFLVACCLELMDALSLAIFMLLLGEWFLDDAIQAIKKDILE